MQRDDDVIDAVRGTKRKRNEDPFEASQSEIDRESSDDRRRRLNREYARKARESKKEYYARLEKEHGEQKATIMTLKTALNDLTAKTLTPEKIELFNIQQVTIDTLSMMVSEKELLIAKLTARLATVAKTNQELQDRLKATVLQKPESNALAQATKIRPPSPLTLFPAPSKTAPQPQQATAFLPIPAEAERPPSAPPQPSAVLRESERTRMSQNQRIPADYPEPGFNLLDFEFNEVDPFDFGLGL